MAVKAYWGRPGVSLLLTRHQESLYLYMVLTNIFTFADTSQLFIFRPLSLYGCGLSNKHSPLGVQ